MFICLTRNLTNSSANLIGSDFKSLLVAYGTSSLSENKVRNEKTKETLPPLIIAVN